MSSQRPPPDPTLIVCDVSALVQPDLRDVDALARTQLAAKRRGRRIALRGTCAELRQLLDLMGLSYVVPCEED